MNATGGHGGGQTDAQRAEAEEQFLYMVADGLLLFACAGLFWLAKRLVARGLLGRSCCSKDTARLRAVIALDIACWACLWFGFSVSLVVYNKWLLKSWEGGFDFPLMISMFHMMLKYLLSLAMVRCTEMRDHIPVIPPRVWWLSAVPVGVATALDVAASNASYLYITVTFYTIVKSTSLVFTLFFSVLYKLQPASIMLTLSVFVIGSGVVMSSYGDTEFSWIGFGLILGASAVGGFRWSLTQVLMKQIECSLDAILTIYLISPASALTLVPMALWLEGYRFFTSRFMSTPHLLVLSVLNIIGAGLFAFAMILVELELLRRTSSLSLGVISYTKQILQVGFSVMVFHDELTFLNVMGFLVTLGGMVLYTFVKQAPNNAHIRSAEDSDGLFVFDDFGHDELGDGLFPDLDYHLEDPGESADELDSGRGEGAAKAKGNGAGEANGQSAKREKSSKHSSYSSVDLA